MTDSRYINPWAEKLSRVTIPDPATSWAAMEVLLDGEMAMRRRKNGKRWLLLIVLLLLLIGVCNCPGRRWFSAARTDIPVPGTNAPNAPVAFATHKGGHPAPKGPQVGSSGPKAGTSTPQGESPTPQGESPKPRANTPPIYARHPWTREKHDGNNRRGETARNESNVPVKSPALESGVPAAAARPPQPAGGAAKKNKPAVRPPASDDDDKKEKQGGFMVGIGLNQFFTIGGQHASSFNSGGITGTLGDYIPVPMLRYYINPKLYIQLEAQFNTPQYTKKNLVAELTPVDSLSTTVRLQTTVAINKLFYFNVPLSVHYTVYDHLDLGAGLQYSRLTNGIGVFNAQYNVSGVDSAVVATKSFKGDSVYRTIKTSEFRFLVDANYMWRHFILGLRYNQALSKFIHVEITPGQVTQARNSSLQLYLRYILWDGRRKKTQLPAK